MNPAGHTDDPFDKDLAQVTKAYRAARPEEPPALLDRAILNRARRAVESKSVRPWNFGWIHAVSTAAVLVLALAILVERPRKPELPAAVPERKELNEILPAPRTPVSADALEVSLEDEAQAEEATDPESYRVQDKTERMPVEKAARPESRQMLEQETAVPLTEEAVRASAADRDQALARRAREADVSGDGAAAAAVTGPGTEGAGEAGADLAEPAVLRTATPGLVGASAPGAGETEGARDERRADAPAELQTGMADQVPEDPETWLARILELQQAGETAAFEAELEAFRIAWPDYPLPPELEARGSGG